LDWAAAEDSARRAGSVWCMHVPTRPCGHGRAPAFAEGCLAPDQLHPPPTPVLRRRAVFDALGELVDRGWIRAYGVSAKMTTEVERRRRSSSRSRHPRRREFWTGRRCRPLRPRGGALGLVFLATVRPASATLSRRGALERVPPRTASVAERATAAGRCTRTRVCRRGHRAGLGRGSRITTAVSDDRSAA
jgi:hypothetical protein